MNHSNLNPISSLEDRIDLACDQYERNWKSGTPLKIAVLLQEFKSTEHESALRELLAVELELRFRRGDMLRKEDYSSLLPGYDTVISELLESTLHEFIPTTPPVGSSGEIVALPDLNQRVTLLHAVPDKIGKYRIVEALDRGGQATVFRAIHPELGRDVVIKFCHLEKSHDANSQEALRSEGRILASLEHPNLARVYDFDFHDNRAYLVMEFVRGQNLSQYRKQHPLAAEAWIPIMRQVAQALSYVHAQGILHLDIKPQNILIDETGTPRLIDFGLARTETVWEQSGPNPATLSGTLQFMSPEQARCEAEAIGPQSDIYGLGGVFYYLVTVKPPVTGDSLRQILDQAQLGNWDRQLLRGSCSDSIRSLIESAMALRCEERLASAAEFAAQLALLEPKPSWLTAKKLRIAIAIALVLVIATIPAMVIMQGTQSTQEAPVTSQVALSELKMRVWRNGNTFDLLDSAPVAEGDRVEARSEIPAGVYVSLFMFSSEGHLQLIESVPAANQAFGFRYPEDSSQFESITGPAGTEFVFLCASRQQPITVQDLNSLSDFGSTWPQLPDDAIIHMRSDVVEFLQRPKGFGGGVETVDPQQVVFDRLSSLRRKMVEQGYLVEGLAFAHVE